MRTLLLIILTAGMAAAQFGFTPNPASYFKFSDWHVPVKQCTLKELGLPAKYAVDSWVWPMIEDGQVSVSTDSYPLTRAHVGDTAEVVYQATPAFKESFKSPTEMVSKLIQACGK